MTLRVGLVVSEASDSDRTNGRFPEAAIRQLVAADALELIAFPEMFRECRSRKQVVPTVRVLAEDFGCAVIAGVWCQDEQMQCAGYWNPDPKRGETQDHFYAKHSTSERLAYELADYAAVRDRLFTPIQLRGRRLGVQLCHDMFFGLVGARWRASGADVLLDLTGSNVNLAKWTNVITARSIEHDAPFLCTMANWRGATGGAKAIAFRAGRPIRPLKEVRRKNDGAVVVFDVEGRLEVGDASEQPFTDKRYSSIRVALGAPRAVADVHVAANGDVGGAPTKGSKWRAFTVAGEKVGVLSLPLLALKDCLAIHRAEPRTSPFAHHVVVFVGRDGELAPRDAIALAKLRAIEHRMAIGILTPSTRELIKTNRYKNIQRFVGHDGVFGLDLMFLGGTYAHAPETGFLGIKRQFLDAYRSLVFGELGGEPR